MKFLRVHKNEVAVMRPKGGKKDTIYKVKFDY